MNLRKSPPEQLIHQSTAPNTYLTFHLQESSLSGESETESQLDAKYEANMRALGHPLCNWQFEKCYLSNWPPMRCQFLNGCSNFAQKRCSILWSRTHGRNVKSIESLGRFCREHTCTTTKRYCRLRQTMEQTVFGHSPILQETMSGLRRM